jgi:hypothetical protein
VAHGVQAPGDPVFHAFIGPVAHSSRFFVFSPGTLGKPCCGTKRWLEWGSCAARRHAFLSDQGLAQPFNTHLVFDDNLIEEARRAGHHKTKKDAVTAALFEYVQRRKQLRILKTFGFFDFDPKYDYKAQRRRKRS